MNTLQMTAIQSIRFACDSIPDCQGQIVERIGSFVIIQGMATDSGYWFAKGVGGARRFGNRQEAVDYIEYAQDAKDGGPGSGPSESGEKRPEDMEGFTPKGIKRPKSEAAKKKQDKEEQLAKHKAEFQKNFGGMSEGQIKNKIKSGG